MVWPVQPRVGVGRHPGARRVSGMTLVGFLRGTTMNVYTGAHRLPS